MEQTKHHGNYGIDDIAVVTLGVHRRLNKLQTQSEINKLVAVTLQQSTEDKFSLRYDTLMKIGGYLVTQAWKQTLPPRGWRKTSDL